MPSGLYRVESWQFNFKAEILWKLGKGRLCSMWGVHSTKEMRVEIQTI